MSADDWLPCPFCSKPFKDRIAELKKERDKNYEILTAKEYDEFKRKLRNTMEVLEHKIRDEATVRIDGVRDYHFSKDGNLAIGIGASCSHCGRYWDISASVAPKSKNGAK